MPKIVKLLKRIFDLISKSEQHEPVFSSTNCLHSEDDAEDNTNDADTSDADEAQANDTPKTSKVKKAK
jgi:hypothetical protein